MQGGAGIQGKLKFMKQGNAPQWTTPELAALDEGRYWKGQTISARVAAVEALRRRVYEGYGDTPPRMERVYRLVEIERS
jgi:hypothetical protein